MMAAKCSPRQRDKPQVDRLEAEIVGCSRASGDKPCCFSAGLTRCECSPRQRDKPLSGLFGAGC
ncbi:hypothetical protein FA039_20255 [Escherichia coli]|nr:hypothetical protein [Escherichia coli]